MRVKIFSKTVDTKMNFLMTKETTDSRLEEEINEWLAGNPDIEISNVLQSQGSLPPRVTVSIWYS